MAYNTTNTKEPLYLQLYAYFKQLIIKGSLKAGEKLPSIRRCALERRVSKTTVEASYMQLCAEGYIYAQPGSGYYVSEIGSVKAANALEQAEDKKQIPRRINYDFTSSSIDNKCFNFEVWRRYMKSALRNTTRLITYGDTQGEEDLRIEIKNYIKEARGVVCSPQQIVIGAGVQSLLNILCALTEERKNICFTGNGFKQGKVIFDDRGYNSYYVEKIETGFEYFKEKKTDMLYVSPSYMTPWGKVMPMKTRSGLLKFAKEEDCFIIEDDYDSEFRYYKKPMLSLQSLDGGSKVIYMGSFSRLLLPSVRIAFMVLPTELMDRYHKKGQYYNQTASTAEQIALCQFIRDGHLKKQIKKARKFYMNKSQQLCSSIQKVFGSKARAIPGEAGFLVRMEIESSRPQELLCKQAEEAGIGIKICTGDNKKPCFLLSSSSVPEEAFDIALKRLRDKWESEGSI